MNNTKTLKLTTTALFVALGLILPMVFHSLGLGNAFSPMHIPVLLCSYICGFFWGGITGLILPYLSSLLTGMPPAFPVAFSMTLELAAYGVFCGLIMELLKKGKLNYTLRLYISLVLGMLIGRLFLGLSNSIIFAINGTNYSFAIFLTSAFLNAWPALLLQIILIPLVVEALKKSHILAKYKVEKPLINPKIITSIDKIIAVKKPIIIAIDGKSGSGKTHFAKVLKRHYKANVFHIDDFYLPRNLHTNDIGGNINFKRFQTEVIEKIINQQPINYKKFDCHRQNYKKAKVILPTSINIVEGVYACYHSLKQFYDYTIYVDIDDAVRIERIKFREDLNAENFVNTWIPKEQIYFEKENIQELANITISDLEA